MNRNSPPSTLLARITLVGTVVLIACAILWASSNTPQAARSELTVHGVPINSSAPVNALPESRSAVSIPGYPPVGFDRLSGFKTTFAYKPTDPNGPAFNGPLLTNLIPEAVRALDGKDVAIEGFMLPLKYSDERVKEFLLLKNQSLCCFGMPPNITEWVDVCMKSKGVKPRMDQPVTLYGTLHVGVFEENKQMLGIYKLDGDGMRIPRDF